MSANEEYDETVRREIEQYARVLDEGGVSSSIPSIFTYWASTSLSPRLHSIFGEVQVESIFAKEIARSRAEETNSVTVLALGSGDAQTEFEIARQLLDMGIEPHIMCTDLNPIVTERARQDSVDMGLAEYFTFVTVDLNLEMPSGTFDAVVVNHSLHHFQNLEFILDGVRNSLVPGGRFVVSDMIGRNGHCRWPEALPFVQALWDSLPDEKRYNNFAGCVEGPYVNYDCTLDDTFEGIRAQDILPLCLERFDFEAFVGHGNVVDIFVDRIYGPNFDPEKRARPTFH